MLQFIEPGQNPRQLGRDHLGPVGLLQLEAVTFLPYLLQFLLEPFVIFLQRALLRRGVITLRR